MTDRVSAAPLDWYPWQVDQWQQVSQMIQQKRLPHALIIGGVAGLGKLKFATKLAAALLCQQQIDNMACGACKSCKLLASNSHPDYKLMQPEEPSKAIVVDQVRKLQHAMATTAQQGGARVVVINGASDLNLNAANALLKQLEEPGDRSYFLLLHQWPQTLLPTVRSRCQLLNIDIPESTQALDWLLQQLPTEERSVDTTIKLLQLANGAPLRALQLHASRAHELRHQMLVQLTAVFRGKESPVDVAKIWHKQPLEQMLSWWIEWLNDLIKLKMTSNAQHLANPDIIKLLQAVDQRSNIIDIYALLERLTEQLNFIHLRRNLNTQLVCEQLLHQWYLLVRSGR